MSLPVIDTVLFDLDGTLIDTNELIIRSFTHALREVRPDLTRAEIIPQMGKPLREQLQFISSRSEVDDLLEEYRTYQKQHHDGLIRIFPGVVEVLRQLRVAGIKIGIVTTKIRTSSLRSLEYFQLMSYIDEIITIEDVVQPKPHPEPILLALQRLGSTADRALMVGDSPFDLQAAQAAGVQAIGVGWSLKGTDCLVEYQPVTMIQEMDELLQLMESVGSKR